MGTHAAVASLTPATEAPDRVTRARQVASPDSPAERQADRAAAAVTGGASVAGWSFVGVPTTAVHRACAAPGLRDTGQTDAALAGSGRPLDAPVRRTMEARFGHDLSRVRLHTGAAAAGAAHELDAAAFTVGDDIAFAAGRDDPGTPAGRHLLAHELAHVVQYAGRSPETLPVHRFSSYSAAEQASDASSGWTHPAGDPLRVSDDGQLAVEDHGWGAGTNKLAWTTPVLVAGANGVLSAQGSRARLRPVSGGTTLTGTAPATGAASNLVQVEPFKPAGGGPFDLAQDCGRAARQVMGSGPAGRDVAVLNRPGVAADDGTGGAVLGGVLGGLGGGALGALLGAGLAGWVAPLIALLARGGQSPVVRAEAVKALNFQIVWAVVGLIGWATACVFIGFIIIPIATLVAIIFGVIAGLKANNNEPYNYPMTINLIK